MCFYANLHAFITHKRILIGLVHNHDDVYYWPLIASGKDKAVVPPLHWEHNIIVWPQAHLSTATFNSFLIENAKYVSPDYILKLSQVYAGHYSTIYIVKKLFVEYISRNGNNIFCHLYDTEIYTRSFQLLRLSF